MKKIIILLIVFFNVVGTYATVTSESEWKTLSGQWQIADGKLIPQSGEDKLTNEYKLLNTLSGDEISWESLSVDFRYTDDPADKHIGILLHIEKPDDYQLLRITPAAERTVIQMLHWKYGYFRMWQEIVLPENLQKETLYTISIVKAPPVDKEDWRSWKIIVKENSTGKILLKQGIENELPAFGLGRVGLYSASGDVVFSDFRFHLNEREKRDKSLILPTVFSDGMVLQRSTSNPVWGKATPGSNIEIHIAGKISKTKASDDGRWEAKIPPLPAGEGLEMDIISQDGKVKIKDIAVGEVWLASGQSNMEMKTWQTDVAPTAEESPKDKNLRLFHQSLWPSEYPVFSSGSEWMYADSEDIQGWSAVVYRFGKELRDSLNVPVGIIGSYWGGTAIESWFPREELANDPITMPILKRYNESLVSLEKGLPLETRFPWCWDVAGQRHTPGNLYNGMIHPLVPYTIKGVIWYQGESNGDKARQYENLFEMFVDSWREAWNKPALPILYVQLEEYDGKESGSHIESAWPQLRDIQRRILDKRDNTAMVVAFHLGDSIDPHPYRKSEIGLRLANLALHDVYNYKDIVSRGPLLDKVEFGNGEARLYFRETASGLATSDGKAAAGFIIAGEDEVFHPAVAVISPDKKSVTVYSDKVPKPAAVRYAWWNYSEIPNLVNSEGLPASPFRTDNWRLATDDSL